jgi:HNH endonuclease
MRDVLRLLRRYERQRRFWRHVRVMGPADCWLWEGHTYQDGRGCYDGRAADVCSYELTRGPLPGRALLAHRCGDPRCVNPEHLVTERCSTGSMA